MKNRLIILSGLVLIASLFLTNCKRNQPLTNEKDDILRKNLDSTNSPAKDFFLFANGTWLKNNPIPPSESNWGIGNLVQEETYKRLREISENAAQEKNAKPGSASQKIGDFWYTGMDSAGIEKNGINPLKPELDLIDAIKDLKGLLDAVAYSKSYGSAALFGLGVSQDQKNSEKMALYVWQGGLGLPNRDYYFNTDARTINIRKEYTAHVTKMLQLLGENEAAARSHSETIMKIETSMASKSRKLQDLRDPYKNYNKMSLENANKLSPSIHWKEMLIKTGVKNPDTLIIGQPEFMQQVETLLKSVKIEDWKTYLRWHLVNDFSEYMSKAFEEEHFNFRGKILDGRKQMRPRWKRVLDAEESAMGEILGQLYVNKYFSPKVKQRYETMVDNVMAAYRVRIQKLDWMTPATKEKALSKLSAVVKKVGYPSKWKDFSALSIKRESYAGNMMAANKWAFNYQLEKLGKPVDRTEWDMTPQTYNAYYNPSNNEIVLPAAMFIIPGLPDSLADDALMYAYVGGSTIGHEITHGFDDEGRQYDAKGNLMNWWTKEDEQKFNEKTRLIEKQFSSYVVLDSLHVNGKASMGENIADLAGIILGYDAFQMTEQAKAGKKVAGFTPDQRYFMGYALSWLGHQRDERLAKQILTDVHSPAFLRVNGPLSDIPEFYKAFDIKPGDAMYRVDSLRVKIW